LLMDYTLWSHQQILAKDARGLEVDCPMQSSMNKEVH
jgi:hypothetical protein